jgi:hypothetical protein
MSYPRIAIAKGTHSVNGPEIVGWGQLVQLWQLIVDFCKFIWYLLRFLGR